MTKPKEKYVEEILQIVKNDKRRIVPILQEVANMPTAEMQCVDRYNHGLGIDIPGTIFFFYNEGHMHDLFALMKREGKLKIKVGYHYYCGYLFSVLKLKTFDTQLDYIASAVAEINKIARYYGIEVIWLKPNQNGTARPHMEEVLL